MDIFCTRRQRSHLDRRKASHFYQLHSVKAWSLPLDGGTGVLDKAVSVSTTTLRTSLVPSKLPQQENALVQKKELHNTTVHRLRPLEQFLVCCFHACNLFVAN